MNLKTKLLTLGITLTTVPLIVVSGAVYTQNSEMRKTAARQSEALAYQDLDHTAEGVYNVVSVQHDLLVSALNHSLNVAKEHLVNAGGLSPSKEEVTEWQARNQLSGAVSTTTLATLRLGEQSLTRNADFSKETPFVDSTSRLIGGAVTLFQRMDEAGALLRVATSVRAADGQRAISTYIPPRNEDGSENVIIKTLRLVCRP